MAKSKGFNVSVLPEEVMYTGISKSKDGYNSARMHIKKGDKEYMSISYEWEGDGVPDFAMNLMSFMQTEGEVIEVSKEEKAAEYTEYLERK